MTESAKAAFGGLIDRLAWTTREQGRPRTARAPTRLNSARSVAAERLLSRFEDLLADSQIMTKADGELVTVADYRPG